MVSSISLFKDPSAGKASSPRTSLERMILSTVGLGISQRHRHCSDRYCRSHDSVIATCNKIESFGIYLARDYRSCDILT